MDNSLFKEAMQLAQEWQYFTSRVMKLDYISTSDLKKKKELDEKTRDLARLKRKDQHRPEQKAKELADLKEKDQHRLVDHRVLAEHQKHFIELFLQNKCTD